jgi:asparagine N-glycosylation enzyme membrane subunit Stt3
MYGKKAGYVAAIIASVVPAFVYRTMAGFFEDDSLGFLWMIIGFYFFVKAVKPMQFNKNTLKNGLIASLFFGLMAWTWEMFLLIPLVLLSYFFVTIIILFFKDIEKQKIIAFSKVFIVTFLVFALIATLHDNGKWINTLTSYIVQYIPISEENIKRTVERGEGLFAFTVGEEGPGHPYFGNKYNALIVFPVAALILIPLRSLLKKQVDNVGFIVFFFILITFFMAFSKLKFTYTLGLPLAAGAGVITIELIEFFKKRSAFEKKIAFLGIGFMVLTGIAAGSFFVTQNVPGIEDARFAGWKEAMLWARNNLPENARFFNWWDEGHWITFITERQVIEDNRNIDVQADMDFAAFALAESEEEAFNLVKKYGATHVIFGEDMLSKAASLAIYKYNSTNLSDPRIQYYAGLKGLGRSFPCSKNVNQLTGEVTYKCGPNELSEVQYSALPVSYSEKPNTSLTQRDLAFVYRNKNNTRMYIIGSLINKLMVARLWFNDPSLKHFKEVYSNDGVKIFEIIY